MGMGAGRPAPESRECIAVRRSSRADLLPCPDEAPSAAARALAMRGAQALDGSGVCPGTAVPFVATSRFLARGRSGPGFVCALRLQERPL